MHWLLKAEPETRIVKGQDVKYTIDDLKEEKIGTWDGVRNNEARKHLLAMRKGDTAFFYRSNCKEPGIVGIMKIVKEAFPDETAHDPKAPYYDPKNPDRWVVVNVEYESHLKRPVLLQEIKSNPELKEMVLVKRSRLSVTPVTDKEWETVTRMANGTTKREHENTIEKGRDNNKSKAVEIESKNPGGLPQASKRRRKI